MSQFRTPPDGYGPRGRSWPARPARSMPTRPWPPGCQPVGAAGPVQLQPPEALLGLVRERYRRIRGLLLIVHGPGEVPRLGAGRGQGREAPGIPPASPLARESPLFDRPRAVAIPRVRAAGQEFHPDEAEVQA